MNVGQLFVMLGLQVNQSSWSQGTSLINGLKRAAAGLAAALSVRSIVSLVEHTTEQATHLVSLSRAMGMSIEQTQEWGYVAQQSGSNLKELSVGMNMFLRNLRLYSEGRGSKVLRDRFAEIGLSGRDARDALKSHEGLQRVMFKTADSLKAIGANGRQATFTQLFGVRAGRAMLADLERGSDGLKELMARRRAMGELSEDDALGLRNLGNRIKDVHIALDALAQKAVAELAPMLLELAEGAVTWIIANRELLTGALEVAIRGVAAAFSVVGSVVNWVSEIIHRAMAGEDGAEAVLIGISVAIATFVLPALWSMAAAVIAATWPFLAIAAAAAVVAYGILKIVRHAKEIGAAITSAIDVVREKAAAFFDYLTGANPADNLAKDLTDAFDEAWETIKQGASDAIDWLGEELRKIPVLGWLGGKIGEGAGMLANWATGDQYLDMVPHDGGVAGTVVAPHEIHNAPTATAQAVAAQAAASQTAGGSAGLQSSVMFGPTSVEINVNSVDEAKRAHEAFRESQTDNALRHAARGVGGEVR